MRNILQKTCGKLLDYVKEIEESDNLVIIRFKGDLDSKTIPCVQFNLESRIREFLNKNILADFEDVKNVDSSTLASLLLVLHDLKKNEKRFGLIHANDLLCTHLKFSKLQDKIKVYGNEEEALQDLS